MERHYTNHNQPKYHSIPHDYKITWENNHPNISREINYWDEIIPELKLYEKGNYNMELSNQELYEKILNHEIEEVKFENLADLKRCIYYGGEIDFAYKGKFYGIGRASETDFYIGEHYSQNCFESSNIEAILDYEIDNKKLRDIVYYITVLDRTI